MRLRFGFWMTVVAAVASAFWEHSAKADSITGEELIGICDEKSKIDKEYCSGFIEGIMDLAEDLTVYSRNNYDQIKMIFEVCRSLDFDVAYNERLMIDWLKENPNYLDRPVAGLIYMLTSALAKCGINDSNLRFTVRNTESLVRKCRSETFLDERYCDGYMHGIVELSTTLTEWTKEKPQRTILPAYMKVCAPPSYDTSSFSKVVPVALKKVLDDKNGGQRPGIYLMMTSATLFQCN